MSFPALQIRVHLLWETSEIWGGGFSEREGTPVLFLLLQRVLFLSWKYYTLQELRQLTEILLLPIWLIWEANVKCRPLWEVLSYDNCFHNKYKKSRDWFEEFSKHIKKKKILEMEPKFLKAL